jgi:hypothetical protein
MHFQLLSIMKGAAKDNFHEISPRKGGEAAQWPSEMYQMRNFGPWKVGKL